MYNCNKCKKEKSEPEMLYIGKVKSQCRECHNKISLAWNRKNYDKVVNAHLIRKYGIDLREYNKLLIQQNNACAICKSMDFGSKQIKFFHVDHNHDTGKVRGLLCNSCNIAIGCFKDNIQLIKNSIEYLLNNGTT